MEIASLAVASIWMSSVQTKSITVCQQKKGVCIHVGNPCGHAVLIQKVKAILTMVAVE